MPRVWNADQTDRAGAALHVFLPPLSALISMPSRLSPRSSPSAARQAPAFAAMSDFSARLIAWQRQHGRHGLPWQNTRDPYRIWMSEIMLQQTQVSTVIPYYAKFLARFPDV